MITFQEVKKQVTTANELCGYHAKIDNIWYSVPLDAGNTEYNEIIRQKDAGTLTIGDP